MSNKSKSFKGLIAVLLVSLSVLLSACGGNPGGDCTGTNAIGHATECAYRVVTGK